MTLFYISSFVTFPYADIDECVEGNRCGLYSTCKNGMGDYHCVNGITTLKIIGKSLNLLYTLTQAATFLVV